MASALLLVMDHMPEKLKKKMEITGAVLDLDTTIELTQSRHNLEDLT